MGARKAPAGLGPRGTALWRDVTKGYSLDDKPAELVILEEACRTADRLEKLDELLRGDADTWAKLVHGTQTNDYELKIDGALCEARQQATVLKQLLAALRLPDEQTGKRPQQRGGGRGSYAPSGKAGGAVASLMDRLGQQA